MYFGYETYKNLIDEILMGLKMTFGDDILSVALFGSVARGTAKKDSDIDLLIIHKEVSYDSAKRFLDLQFEMEDKEAYKELRNRGFYPCLSPIFMTSDELSIKPLILLDIMDHGIILKDEEGVLLDKIQKLKIRLGELGSKKIVFEDGSWAWDLKPDWKIGEVIEITL